MRVLATDAIVDAIAVAYVKAARRAVAPNGVLNKAGEYGRECRIELSRINARGNQLDDGTASELPVALVAVRVLGGEFP